MSANVSVRRLNLLRGVYAATAVYLGVRVWPQLIAGPELDGSLPGVAVSVYGAMTVLCVVGIRSPLAMLPVLLLQLTYKVVWLLTVGLPHGFAGPAAELSLPFAAVAAGDIILIPWRTVAARYGSASAEAWRTRPATGAAAPSAVPPT